MFDMEIENFQRRLNIWNLVVGIIYIALSVFLFRDPKASLAAFVIVFGIILIARGVLCFLARKNIRELTGIKENYLILLGIVYILLGIFFIVNRNLAVMSLPYALAIWFIFEGIYSAIIIAPIRLLTSWGYGWSFVSFLLIALLGILLVTNPIASLGAMAYLVGIYFLLIGISHIIAAFSN